MSVVVLSSGINSVSGGGGFAPDDIAGLVQWLKASNLGLADGDPVGSWTDLSGNGNHGTNTGSARPTFKTGIVNGKAVLRFDGGDDFLLMGNFSALTEAEIFIVVKIDADPPGAEAQSGLWSFGTSGESVHFPYPSGTIYDGWGSTARRTTVNPVPSLSAAFRIYSVWSAAGDWSNYLDGAELFADATNTVAFGVAAMLGRSANPVFLDGDVAEVIFYDHKLTGGERTQILEYLQAEYGL